MHYLRLPEQLQQQASNLINEAKTLELQGNYLAAIEKYKNVIEILTKLIELYPDYKLNQAYVEVIGKCQAKIKELQSYLSRQQFDVSFNPWITQKPNVKWEDVIGLEEAKNAILESIIYPAKRPDLYPLGWPRNVLLFGPPGCGKTYFCAAIANELDAVLFEVDAPSIFSKWLGESEKNVERLFNLARKMEQENKVVMIFIDEVDSIFGFRATEVGGEARVKNQFLKEMEGLKNISMNRKIYIFAATNKPWLLEPGFLRRFHLRLYIPPPNLNERKRLFIKYSSPLNPSPDVDFEKLAELTENFSSSDIKEICIRVQNSLAREIIEKGYNITNLRRPHMNDFLKIISNFKPSISPELIRKYEEWSRQYKSI
ncbi:MAG: AAA family ATPase [Thermoproteota archaeon]|nr:AAA family ATPase [Thermoproteota archaeon]